MRPQKSALPLVALLLMIFVCPATYAAILYVGPGETYTEIQPALDAAVDGVDTVIVRDGTYTGANNKNLDFGGKAIALRSQNGADNCIINCQNDGRAFNFHSGETTASVVDGFTVINGNVTTYVIISGGGIRCDNASPTISNCRIMNNIAESSGGGIFCLNGSSPIITGCKIKENYADIGGGIYCGNSSSPSIDACVISDNTAETGGGIGIAFSCAPTINNCSITGNAVSYNGGGVDCYDAVAFLTNCTIASNTSTEGWGGGIMCHVLSSVTVVNCILWGNSVPIFGNEAAIYIDATLDVSYSDVEDEVLSIYVDPDGILAWGPGNFGASIMDHPSFVGNGDYHLRGDSPCINRGTSTGIVADIDDEARPNGIAHDVGSDEYYPPEISLDPTTLANSCLEGRNAQTQGFDVSNSGSGTLFYSITDDVNWLTCSPVDGDATNESDTIDVVYDTSLLGAGSYHATITITDEYATNDPQYITIELTVIPELTQIDMQSPANGSSIQFAPTFTWTADGGADNRYVVDLFIYPSGPLWTAPITSEADWGMPIGIWNLIPSGTYVVWRVRGADLDVIPLSIVASDSIWWFWKM